VNDLQIYIFVLEYKIPFTIFIPHYLITKISPTKQVINRRYGGGDLKIIAPITTICYNDINTITKRKDFLYGLRFKNILAYQKVQKANCGE
jgi:hypothetical protein